MSLADLVEQKRSVETNGGSFDVGGLTLEGIAILGKKHFGEMADLFEGKADIADVVTRSPAFVAELIARCAGEPEAAEQAAKLTIGAQVAALEAIWALTEVDTKKVSAYMEKALAMLQNTRAAIETAPASQAGSTASANSPSS